LLTRTIFGRSVYALGGGVEATRRLGISVKRTQTKIYLLVGGLSGLAGILYVSLQRKANPYDLAGSELDVIAAVVLGGASIMGGYGTVFGTVLGVLFINMIKNNLILLGVNSSWQRAAVGVLLVIGITIQAISENRRNKARRASTEAEG
jgi:simple sugar transport system permease protein